MQLGDPLQLPGRGQLRPGLLGGLQLLVSDLQSLGGFQAGFPRPGEPTAQGGDRFGNPDALQETDRGPRPFGRSGQLLDLGAAGGQLRFGFVQLDP